jgi:hypothetical protein
MNVIIPSYKRSHDLKGKDYFFMAKYCVPESQFNDYIKVLNEDRIIMILLCQESEIIRNNATL